MLEFLDSISIVGGGANTTQTTNINIDGNTTIIASGTVTIQGQSVSGVAIHAFSPALIALSVAQATSGSTVDIGSGVTIEAGGNVTISSAATNTMTVDTTNLSISSLAQAVLGLDFVVGVVVSSATAHTSVDQGATIDSLDGSVSVTSTASRDINNSSFGGGGFDTFDLVLALTVSSTDAETDVAGTIDAAQGITVSATANPTASGTTPGDATSAASIIGDGFVGTPALAANTIRSYNTLKSAAAEYSQSSSELYRNIGKSAQARATKQEQQAAAGATSKAKSGFSGAVAVAIDTNTALATIEGTAVIDAGGNVSVKSSVTDALTASAAGEVLNLANVGAFTSPSWGDYQASQSLSKKNAGAVAIQFSYLTNDSEATVDPMAVINAAGCVMIDATTTIPISPQVEQAQNAFSNLANFEAFAKESVLTLLTNDLGVESYFTTWSQSAANGTNNGVAFSVDVYVLSNTTEATIGSGAEINQDEAQSSAAQNVSVKAETDVETLNVSGVLPVLFQNVTRFNPSFPYGASGSGTGVGGALLGLAYLDTTEASIAGGAPVRGHNVSVDATTNLLDVAIGAASGKAGRTAIDGSATVVVVENTTTADIADGATVDAGGDVSVSAGDSLVNVTVAGSALSGSNDGIGVSVGVNVIERDTSAYIGAPDGTKPTGAPAVIDALGDVTVEAQNSGLNIGLALAGSFINPGPQPASGTPPAGGGGGESQVQSQSEDPSDVVQSLSEFLGDDPAEDAFAGDAVEGVDLPDGQSVEPPAANTPTPTPSPTSTPPSTSISVAGDVVVDYVDDTTLAAINEPASTTPTITSADLLTVKATNDSQDVSVTGSAASDTQTVKSTGFAGSLGVNAVISTTKAFISGGFIQADQLAMDSDRGGFIGAITAGGSGAPKATGTAIAGSVSINILLPNTDAYVTNSTLDLADDSHVSAADSSLIWSVAGAGAYGGAGGYGAAIAVNLIGFSNQVQIIPNQPATTDAYITGSTVNMTGGTLKVSARMRTAPPTRGSSPSPGSSGSATGRRPAPGPAWSRST